MGYEPTYRESHLVVAALRILEHRTGKSPTPEEIADFLEINREKVGILVHELDKKKVLRVLQSPFDVRVDIVDPKPLETLPAEGDAPAVTEELADFAAKSKQKKQEMEEMLRGGEAEKRRRERVAKLEQEFKSFKPKKGELDSLFGSSSQDNDEDDDD